MAFAYTKVHTMPIGNKKMVYGTFTGTTAGDDDILTGLTNIDTAGITDSTGEADTAPQISFDGGTMTVNTVGSHDGTWWALGH